MDGTRFDALTRALTTSRRGIFGTLLAGVLLVVRAQEALACKNFGRQCDRDSDCCAGMKCRNGECDCENGFSKCDNRCYDLDTDEAHCGACDTVCGAGETCCSGTCVDLTISRDYCGACGVACAADEICLAGACTPCPADNQICGNVCCSPSQTCCDGTCVDDLESNENHCGACGKRCPRICTEEQGDPPICNGPRCCSGGVCLKSKSLQSNPDNCGACGHACAAGESCCNGECVDFDSDAGNCGECGNDCVENSGLPDASCCAGACCGDRGGAMRCCEDRCIDVAFDPLNCGACGLVCAGLVCCGSTCCPPLAECNVVTRECIFDPD
jgi:hypothetical protein